MSTPPHEFGKMLVLLGGLNNVEYSNYLQTPSHEALNTEYTNHEAELRYDSETWEVSFSNEKSKKISKHNKVWMPASILKY